MNMKKIKITKEHLSYLFGGLGTALVIFILGYVFIPKEDEAKSEIKFGDGTIINDGNFAGRDIVIEADDNGELISILNYRAEVINSKLSEYYYYSDIKRFLTEFNALHLKVISALKRGDKILAHELIGDIHRLSYRLEMTEANGFKTAEFPEMEYSLPKFRQDGLIGDIIHPYIYGGFKKEPHRNYFDLMNHSITTNSPLENANVFDTIIKYSKQIYTEGYNGEKRFNYNYKNPEVVALILQARGAVIKANLSKHYNYVNTKKYLQEFDALNQKNITAIVNGNYLRSHFILKDILWLSYYLEYEESTKIDSINNTSTRVKEITIIGRKNLNMFIGKLANKYILDKWQIKSDSIYPIDLTREMGAFNIYDSLLIKSENTKQSLKSVRVEKRLNLTR